MMDRRRFFAILGGLIVVPKFGRFYRAPPVQGFTDISELYVRKEALGFMITQEMLEDDMYVNLVLGGMPHTYIQQLAKDVLDIKTKEAERRESGQLCSDDVPILPIQVRPAYQAGVDFAKKIWSPGIWRGLARGPGDLV